MGCSTTTILAQLVLEPDAGAGVVHTIRVTAGRQRARRNTRTLKRNSSREGAPLGQCGGASLLVDLAGDEMALVVEMVVDLGVN
jgi:hypothetical protein